MDKKALRKELLDRRSALGALDLLGFEEQTVRFLKKRRPSSVGAYYSIGTEVPVFPILLKRFSGTLALPVITDPKARAMVFAKAGAQTPLRQGTYGIPEPEVVAAVEPECLFVPALGVDASGARLGYGGGYYDRYLASHPGVYAVGVVAEAFFLEAVPQEGTDVRLNALITEACVRYF